MARKKDQPTASTPTIVYRYGAQAPVLGADRAEDQLRAAHRYRNTLTELALLNRDAAGAWLRQIAPDYAEAEAECARIESLIEDAYGRAGEMRQRARSRIKLPPELDGEIKILKSQRKEASVARGKAKAALLQQLSPELATLEPEYRAKVNGLSAKELKQRLADDADLARLKARIEAARKRANADIYGELSVATNELQKSARAATETYWGTYLQIEEAADKSRQSGAAPRFSPWRGEGKLSVQIQSTKPLTVESLHELTDTRLRLERVLGTRKQHYRLWMRVGSEGRNPVWCVVPFVMHRPLPAGARVAGCHLLRRKVAESDQWSVQFVLQRAGGWTKETAESGRVAIDVGYRMVEGGLRVAFWRGDDGSSGQLLIPAGDEAPLIRRKIQRRKELGGGKYIKEFRDDRLKQYAKTAELQGVRTDNFNLARERLSNWLRNAEIPAWLNDSVRNRPRPKTSTVAEYVRTWLERHPRDCWLRSWLVDWLQRREAEAAPLADPEAGRMTLGQWRSIARLARLVVRWRDNRFPGDEEMFAELEAWRKQDKHLHQWQEHGRQAFRDWRLNLYRTFAAELRKRYKTVVLEDMDLRQLARRPKPDEAKKDGALDHNRTVAALGTLMTALKQSGMQVELREAAYTTMRCADCGHVSQWDERARARQYVTCEGCSRTYDQDDNAARNLLGGVASGAVAR